ncbi:reverse transcriptase domain-containing protein, partial [Tanacetum coccineum]
MNSNNIQGWPHAGLPPQNHNGPPKLNLQIPALDLRTMEELCQPTMNGLGRPIAPVNIQATDFGLKNHMIQQVQNSCQIHGLPGDDANKHLYKFLTITQSMKQNGVTDDALRLYLFPHLLTLHATAYFDHLPKNSIHTFQEIAVKFLSKYFPPSMNQGQSYNQNIPQLTYPSTDEMLRNFMISTDAKFNSLATSVIEIQNSLQERPQGVLPSNTIPNPQADLKVITTQSGMTLAEPLVPPPALSSSEEVERDPETIMDQVLTESTIRVPPPVVQPSPIYRSSELPPVPASSSVIPEKNPHQPPMSYPSSLNKEKLQDKSDKQIHNFLQMFKKLHFNISFPEALAYMPKYAKMVKDLLTNKEKLFKLVNTPLNESCSTVLLKKLLEKLGDTRRFLIPCEFQELESCTALADLGASINLMPLSVWKKLILPELTPTRMTLELATRAVAYPAVDYDVDPQVPIILGRPFLRTAHALVDVHGEELTLRVGDEKLVFNVELESLSPSFTPFRDNDFLLEETDAFLSLDDSIPPGIDNGIYDSEGDILFLEELLNDDPTFDLPPPLPVFENNEIEKIKTSIDDPPNLELKDLPPHLEYVFLEGNSKLPVI